MRWFKVVNRVVNSSVCLPRAFIRLLQDNGRKIPEIPRYEAPRLENDGIHKTLEYIPAYQNHVLPSPNSCRKLTNFNKYETTSENCNCTEKCRLSVKAISEFVGSDPKSVINVKDLFSNSDSSFSVHKPKQNFIQTSLKENTFGLFIREVLEKLLTSRGIDDPHVFRVLSMKLPSVSDLELTQIMIYASLWQLKQEAHFSLLSNELDKECCKRYLNWQVEHQLYVADIWYHLNMSRVCIYNSKVIENMSRKLNELTKFQLIHLLFIINLRRKASLELMLKIEKIVENEIHSFTIEEIVVIAMAYFKTSTKITSSIIISSMINLLIKSILNMKSSEIICVVKTLRYSYRYENKHLIEELLKKAVKDRIWKEYFPLAAHLCLLAHRHDVYMPELLDSVITDMIEFENVRLKDIAKVLSTVSKFSHSASSIRHRLFEFCQKQFDHPNRREELDKYYQMYISSLLNLSYIGIFIHEELHKAFSNKSMKLDRNFSRDLATLDCNTEIDEPEYTGNRLDANERLGILQQYHLCYPTFCTTKTFLENITMNMQNVLQQILNTKLSTMHVLPYMVDPVFLLIFKNGQLDKPSVEFMDLISKGYLTGPTNKNDWVVIWPLSKKEMYSSQDFVGLSLVKERHFIKLGFKLIKVPPNVCINFEKIKRFLEDNLQCFLTRS